MADDLVPTTPAVRPDPPTPTGAVPDSPTAPASPRLDATTARDTAHPIVPPGTARYVFGDEIARGGMGAVFRGTDTVFHREVAVKVLQDDCPADSALARRFADEARIAAQLQHPGIPPVHDYGVLPDGRPFLAMKLIKGDTLAALLDRRRDAADDRGRFVAVFEHVCHAIAYAHARGVIHRDLKPSNVMVGAFGEVQVMDWGLAKVLSVESAREGIDADPGATDIRSLREGPDDATRDGAAIGTPAYMPPEQAIGAHDQIDRRSDVFGLGGILAAILTGRTPFDGDTPEATRRNAAQGKVGSCIARLEACGADPELVALCRRCLNPTPDDRPSGAAAVAGAVTGLRQAAEERARQAELDRVRGEERRKQRRVQLALLVALGLVVLSAAVGSGFAKLWQDAASARDGEKAARSAAEGARDAEKVARGAAETARDGERAARTTADAATAKLVVAEERLAHIEYGRTMLLAHQAWRDNDSTTARRLLRETRPELRGWEWNYVHRLCHADLVTLRGHTDQVFSAAFNPDGSRVVTASGDTTARVWDSRHGSVLVTLNGHTDGVASAMFSPDGSRVLTASWDKTARVWDAQTGQPLVTLNGHT
ncbi:MAG TPA: protein kinase, partial [Urbifossiella sp.]|nr:protein kinase [Urbifossiella sp.]